MKSTKSMFVYGTLMENQRNFKYFNDNVIEIKRGYIRGDLYHLIDYNCPAITLGNDKVYGELITYVDPTDTIEQEIDALERDFGHDDSRIRYDRFNVAVYVEGQEYQSSAYFLNRIDTVKTKKINQYWKSEN